MATLTRLSAFADALRASSSVFWAWSVMDRASIRPKVAAATTTPMTSTARATVTADHGTGRISSSTVSVRSASTATISGGTSTTAQRTRGGRVTGAARRWRTKRARGRSRPGCHAAWIVARDLAEHSPQASSGPGWQVGHQNVRRGSVRAPGARRG